MLTKDKIASVFDFYDKLELSEDLFSDKDPFERNILFHALSRDDKSLVSYLLGGVMSVKDIFDEHNIKFLSSVSDIAVHRQFVDKFITSIPLLSKPFNIIPPVWYGGLLFWGFDEEANKLLDACEVHKKQLDLGGFVYLEQHFKTGNLKNYKRLLREEFNYNNPDFSILATASFYKHWDVVKYLVKDFGLCPNLGSAREVLYDKTADKFPLINALSASNFEMVDFLLDNGALANISGSSSSFKLSWALALKNNAPNHTLEKMLPTGGIIEIGEGGHERFNLFKEYLNTYSDFERFKFLVEQSSWVDFLKAGVIQATIVKNKQREFDFLMEFTSPSVQEINNTYAHTIFYSLGKNTINPEYFMDRLDREYFKGNFAFSDAVGSLHLNDFATYSQNKKLAERTLPLLKNKDFTIQKPLMENGEFQGALLVRAIRSGALEILPLIKEEMLKRGLSLDVYASSATNQGQIPLPMFFFSTVNWSQEIVDNCLACDFFNVNQEDANGKNILFYNLHTTSAPKILQYLMSKDVNTGKLVNGRNALFYGNVPLLLQYTDIDFSLVDNSGQNFIEYRLENNTADFFKQPKLFKDILFKVKDILTLDLVEKIKTKLSKFDDGLKEESLAILDGVVLERSLSLSSKTKKSLKV